MKKWGVIMTHDATASRWPCDPVERCAVPSHWRLEPGSYQQFEFVEMVARIWDEGFDACANWWEIHHHGVARDEQNPYRRTSQGAAK